MTATIDLVPAEGFVLHLCGVAAEDAGRFVRLFGETWRLLKPDVRHLLIWAWFGARMEQKESRPGVIPCFELAEDLERRCVGLYRHSQHRFAFSARKIFCLPDALVRALVAHELAHSYLAYLVDDWQHGEDCADAFAIKWGFSQMVQLRRLRWLEDGEWSCFLDSGLPNAPA